MRTAGHEEGRAAQTGADRRSGEERRRELVRAAFDVIAELGFEGLRTREVAARAGVNIATLHYYFPAKEDLVRGVVDEISREFDEQGARIAASGVTAWERLHAELAQTDEMPRDLQIVLQEFSLRSLRDAAVHAIFATMDAGWHESIVTLLRDGIREGSVRPNLDLDAAAYAVMAYVRGTMSAMIRNPDDGRHAHAVAELERWLRADSNASDTTAPPTALRTSAPPGVPVPTTKETN